MVLLNRRASTQATEQVAKKGKIILASLLALICFIIPVVIKIIDPIHMLVNYNLSLRPGSFLYGLLSNEFDGPRLYFYLFNISNADKFMSGEDRKIKVKEVGPFVYKEVRWYEDMQLNEDGTEMAMTIKIRPEFIPEESIGHPEDINMTLPNVPLLSITSVVSTYPGLLRFMYNNIVTQTNTKAIVHIDAHKFFWSFKSPLVVLCNKLLPGLVYYDSFGVLDRLYDKEADYRITVGATVKDRFKIKSVKKVRHLHEETFNDAIESEQTFPDTYDGVGYPPELTPEIPINWYRTPFCKTIGLQYTGEKTMYYGGEALVYTLHKNNFVNQSNSITNKMYPEGLMDLSACYFGTPFVLSKPHYLDADPKLLESIEGLVPDKEKYSTEVVIDRRAAITFNTRLSLQLSIIMDDDISFNKEARRFSNTIVPLLRARVDQAKMDDTKMMLFYLAYRILPAIQLTMEVVLVTIGVLLVIYSVRSMSLNCSNNKRINFTTIREKTRLTETLSGVPLVSEKR